MKNFNKVLLLVFVLSLSLSVCGRKLRRSARLDKCEQYFRRAMRTTNMHDRLRYLQNAMSHAKDKEQKVRVLVQEAYTQRHLKNKELALMTIENGLKLRSLNSRLEDKLMSTKINLCHWYGIRDEKLVAAAQKLVYDSDYRNSYTLYFYIGYHYLRKKQYQRAFDLYKMLERRATKDSRAYHMALIQQVNVAGRYLKRTYEVGIAIRKMERSNTPSNLLSQFYYCAGKAYKIANDNTQAMKYYNKSIENHCQHYTCLAFLGKGELLKKTGKTTEALECFRRAQAMTKHSPHCYSAAVNIADIYVEKKNYNEAIKAIEMAAKKIDSKHHDYRGKLLLKMAGINAECKKNKLAAKQYKIISENLNFSKGIRNLALKQFDRQINSEAIEMLDKANELLKLRKYDLALTEAQKATASSKPHSNFYYSSIFKQIYILLRMKNTSEALNVFNTIKLKNMPESTKAGYYSYKVRVYTALEEPEKVISAYKDYAKYSERAYLALANYLQRIKRTKEALKAYDGIIKDPKSRKYYKIKAAMAVSNILLAQGEDKKAIKALAKAFKFKGISVDEKAKITLLAAEIYVKYGYKDKAIRLAKRIKRNRKTSRAIRKQCITFIWEANNQESVILMKKAKSQISQGNLGESLLIINNIINTCSSRGEWYQKALLKKMDILLRLKNYDKLAGIIDLQTYRRMNPVLRESYHRKMAYAYRAMNNYDMASKEYEKLIKLGHKSCMFHQANVLKTAKRFDEALKLYGQCFKEKLNIYNAALKMAEIYTTQKNNQKALDILKEAYASSSSYSSIKFLILYQIAVLYKKQGKKDEAKTNLQAIITNDLAPENYKKMAQEKLKEI